MSFFEVEVGCLYCSGLLGASTPLIASDRLSQRLQLFSFLWFCVFDVLFLAEIKPKYVKICDDSETVKTVCFATFLCFTLKWFLKCYTFLNIIFMKMCWKSKRQYWLIYNKCFITMYLLTFIILMSRYSLVNIMKDIYASWFIVCNITIFTTSLIDIHHVHITQRGKK